MSLPRLVLACALAGASAVNHTLGYLPFSWDTLPRYTFCVNSSGPLNDEALAYVAKQPIFLNNPVLTRPAGSIAQDPRGVVSIRRVGGVSVRARWRKRRN